MAKGKREKQSEKKGAKSWIIAPVIVGVLALAAFGFCIFVNCQTGIYKGVTVGGVELGGMSQSEAEQAIIASGIAESGQRSLTVTLPGDNLLVIDAGEAGALPQASGLARAAYRYGREKPLIGAAAAWLKSALRGEEIRAENGPLNEEYVRSAVREAAQRADAALMGSDMEIGEDSLTLVKGVSQVLVDEDALCTGVMSALENGDYSGFSYTPELRGDDGIDLHQIYDTLHQEAEDAVFDKEKGILPHTVGREFDLENAQMLWESAAPGEKVVIPLIVTEPEVTEEWLEEHLFADVLGERTSGLTNSSAARVNNLQVACGSINDVILMPGEEFSYNDTLGKRTEAAGYKPAGAYLNGKVVTEVGGGICQVSSTLYCATLLANLKITARTNHYFGVDYLPAGLDATVSWGGPEYKFVNNREYPVKIRASVDREKWNMTVAILGTDTDGSYVELETRTWGIDGGYGATSYRVVYDADGKLISRTEEATSRYHYHVEEEEEEEKPEETPEVSPEPTEDPEVSPEPTENPEVSPEPTENPEPTPEEGPAPSETPEESPAPEETPGE